jgi:hypothetical protein
MANLGSFGAARQQAEATGELDTFGFLGEEGFRIRPGAMGGAALAQFSEAIVSEADTQGAEAMAAMLAIMRDVLVPEDYQRWWHTYKDRRGSTEDLGELVSVLVKHLSGRPTERPSASPDGSSPTGSDSSGLSLPAPSVPPSQQATQQPLQAVPDGNGGYIASQPG